MTVSVWVPVVVALIAAAPLVYAARMNRRNTEDTALTKEHEMALLGMQTLLTQVMEDREYCWKRVAQLQDKLENETRYRRKK